MSNPVQEFVRPLVDSSVRTVSNTVSGTRDLAVSSAHWFAKGRRPVHVVTESSLRLNTITHKSIARLLNVQAEMVEGTLTGMAKRLETAANANSVRELLSDQVSMMPATRDRFVGDARKAIDVFTDTGEDIRDLVSKTVSDFRDEGETTVTSVAKKAKKKARRATKKTGNAAKRATAKTRKSVTSAKKTASKKARNAAK